MEAKTGAECLQLCLAPSRWIPNLSPLSVPRCSYELRSSVKKRERPSHVTFGCPGLRGDRPSVGKITGSRNSGLWRREATDSCPGVLGGSPQAVGLGKLEGDCSDCFLRRQSPLTASVITAKGELASQPHTAVGGPIIAGYCSDSPGFPAADVTLCLSRT